MGKVYANLMRAAGLGKHTKGEVSPRPSVDFDECLGRPTGGVIAADCHFFALVGMDSNGFPNPVAVTVESPPSKREVLFLDLTCLELLSQCLVSLIIFGNENHAARITIQSMHDPRTLGPTNLT